MKCTPHFASFRCLSDWFLSFFDGKIFSKDGKVIDQFDKPREVAPKVINKSINPKKVDKIKKVTTGEKKKIVTNKKKW